MRKTVPFLAVIAIVGLIAGGCAGPEQKFGRGMSNSLEILRLGELRRSMEQTALTDGPDVAYTTGFIKGLNKTIAREGLGIYEMVTFPIPSYDPIFTDYLSPTPVYPDNYAPGLPSDSTFNTDSNLGFGGGDIMPMVPGSRFRIFDTQ